MPICEPGSSLLPYEDDGSKKFSQIWDAVQDGNTLRRFEGKAPKRKSGKKRK